MTVKKFLAEKLVSSSSANCPCGPRNCSSVGCNAKAGTSKCYKNIKKVYEK